MAVTQEQARQAHDGSNQLMLAAQALLLYTNRVNNLFDSGFKLLVPGSNELVQIPQDAQDRLIDVAKYQTLKDALVAAFNALP